MLATAIAIETNVRVSETDTSVNRKLPFLATNSTIGDRLLEAFGTSDKDFIAKTLGFETKRAIYKVLSGERELDFEKLQKFRNYTKCSIDWLLTGDGPKEIEGFREFNIERSIERHNDWIDVVKDWYDFEGRQMPDTMGASFMDGWKAMKRHQQIDAISDFKRFLDRIQDN